MAAKLNIDILIKCGLEAPEAERFIAAISNLNASLEQTEAWQWITRHLLTSEHPVELHEYLYRTVYADWDSALGTAPAWIPDQADSSNIAWLMKKTGKKTYGQLHKWSVSDRPAFWATMIERLDICFKNPYTSVLDISDGVEHPQWLRGAELNVADSCFRASGDSIAIVYQAENGSIKQVSVVGLRSLVCRVANGLVELGFNVGDRVAICMPMTVEAVAIFLGVIAAGGAVVAIADSFAPEEIEVRLKIGKAKYIFTQDYSLRSGKKLPLYEKVRAGRAPRAIVLPAGERLGCPLREGDISWQEFLSDRTEFTTVACSPSTFSTILFSSGTTGTPKAIPWDHTTPLKSAIDAHLHHDIRPGDVVCWPTNLGWMMGPWLVYAALINRATIALHYGIPTTREFGQFVEAAGVTMLGLVPSIVSAWKSSGCMAGLDFSGIRAFSSTGECSNSQDMLFLMSLAGYKPVIEYCGGTEIGGGYITGTVVQPCAPGTFSTPALGSDLVILDEQGKRADCGEVFLIPPSMGLSEQLLDRDHHEVYYADTPLGPDGQLLRRHGDQMERFANGYFRAHGRVDDSMNLSGIKISSTQIEDVVGRVDSVLEAAAIAVSPPAGGPKQLIVYAVLSKGQSADAESLKSAMQQEIRSRLNPLFKIHDVVFTDALPRTASNKVMRRTLRAEYEKQMLP